MVNRTDKGMKKKVLILGSNGFIGKSLIHNMREKYLISAYDRSNLENVDGSEIKYYTGNFLEDDFLDVTKGIDIVIHLICTILPHEKTSELIKECEDNLFPTIRLLEAMRINGVSNIIFASSAGTVYGNTEIVRSEDSPLNPVCSYGQLKATIESYIKFYCSKNGIDYRIARISNPYGMGQDKKRTQGVIPIYLRRLFNSEEITVFGKGNEKRDYIFLDDVCRGLISTCEYSGEKRIFHIASGHSYELNEIIKKIENVTGKKFKKINFLETRDFDVNNVLLEVEETYKELNWKPIVSLEEGIRNLAEVLEKE